MVTYSYITFDSVTFIEEIVDCFEFELFDEEVFCDKTFFILAIVFGPKLKYLVLIIFRL